MKDSLKKISKSNVDQKQFIELTETLVEILVDFGILTLQAVQNKKQTTLNAKQIEEVINFDLQFRLLQINDPELLDIIRERTTQEFLKIQKR